MGTRSETPARLLRIHHIFVACVVAAIVVLGAAGFVWAERAVILVVDGEARYAMTRAEALAWGRRTVTITILP